MFYKHFTAIQIHCKGDLESDICFVEGDIKIEGSCIISQTVIAYGDIHIHEECEVDMLISIHGNIVIDGPTKGELYRGQEILLRGKNNYVRALQSHKHIQVSDGIIEADIMIAPRVNLHPQLQGRIMVVDSQKSLGPHLVKGCLGMDFLDSFIETLSPFRKTKKCSFFLCHTNIRRLNRKKCTITRCRCSKRNRPRHNVDRRTNERIVWEIKKEPIEESKNFNKHCYSKKKKNPT